MAPLPPMPERHHRDIQGGAARAAVFGISDGLVTNVSLIVGVAAAGPAPAVVRVAALASLIAGSFSMAAGEYVSMRAQAELLASELAKERIELAAHPQDEYRELVQIYVNRGVKADIAEALATQLMRDPELALQTHAREELGVDPNQLGNPWAAAVSSFVTFAIGAAIPLIPWFFANKTLATALSIGLAVAASIAIGLILARFTGRPPMRSAVRQLAIGAIATVVTFAVGRVLRVSVS